MPKLPPITESPLHREDARFRQWYERLASQEQERVERSLKAYQEKSARLAGERVHHIIRPGRVPGGYKAWRDLRTVDHSAHLLRRELRKQIDQVVGVDLTAGPAIRAVSQVALRRTFDLTNSMITLWEERHELSAAILSRAVVETVAVFDTVATVVSDAHSKDDRTAMGAVLRRALQGSQIAIEGEELPLPLKVSEAMKQLGTRQRNAADFYAQISNVVHPNGGGTLPWLASSSGSTLQFGEPALSAAERFAPVYNALLCVPYWLSQDIDALKRIAEEREAMPLP